LIKWLARPSASSHSTRNPFISPGSVIPSGCRPSRIAESLFRKAIGNDRQSVTAAIFWLKTRAGWKETSVHELNGLHLTVATEPMSPAELDAHILDWERTFGA
jgi:hypothetical protein